MDPRKPGDRMGHEWMGIVEEAGAEVRTIKKGDRVISPFVTSDGTCEFCRAGLQSSCVHVGFWGGPNDGGQGEAVRVPADCHPFSTRSSPTRTWPCGEQAPGHVPRT
nr:alcohol dehydrogenase catalytic domain-containing protein [Dictyobacter formicarum]